MSFLKNSFNGGELGDSLRYRPELEKYSSSLARCKNFFPTPWGGVQNRAGTIYCADLGAGDCRLIEFVYNVRDTYVIAAQDKVFRIFRDGVLRGTVDTPYPEDSLFKISFVQSNDVMFLAHPDFPPAMLKRLSDTAFVYEVMSFNGDAFMDEDEREIKLTASGTSGAVTVTAETGVFDAGMTGALLRFAVPMSPNTIFETFKKVVEKDDDGNVIAVTEEANRTGEKSLTFRGSWRLITGGSWIGTLYVERSKDGEKWSVFREYSVNAERNIDDTGFEEEKYSYRMRYANWEDAPEGTLYECRATLQSESYETWGVIRIDAVTSATVIQGTVLEPLSGKESSTWCLNSWNNYNGYPALVQFSDGDRLVFARTYREPNRLWMSQVGNYVNFTGDTLADSAISAKLHIGGGNGSVTGNAISFITNRKGLVIGSWAEIGRFLPMQENSPLAPDNKQYLGEINPGADDFPPIQINDVIVFVRRGRENILELSYSYATDGYVAPDMTILRPEILREGNGLRQMAFVELPFPVIYCVRNDGVIATFTYNRAENVTAWARQVTDGEFLSVAVLPKENGYDEVFAAVRRGDKVFLEKFDKRNDARQNSCVWMDCCSVITNEADGDEVKNTIEELTISRFSGKKVGVKADGDFYTVDVAESGEIHLREPAEVVEIGLPYEAHIRTLPLEMMNGTESSLDVKKRISKVYFKFQNTLGGLVSSSDHPEMKLVFRDMKDLNDGPQPVKSGTFDVSLPDRWTYEKDISITQNQPYPMTVLAMICELEA